MVAHLCWSLRQSRFGLRIFPSPGQIDPIVGLLIEDDETVQLVRYRHRAIERQIATEPVDLVFLEDNRPLAAQIVQPSFNFARAEASVAATSPAGDQKGSTAIATGSSPDLTQFVQLENNAELGGGQATEEIEAIKRKLLTASDGERRKLQAALDATQNSLDVLQAGSATLHQLVEWLRAFAGRETGDLASTIDDLARTVPEVTCRKSLKEVEGPLIH